MSNRVGFLAHACALCAALGGMALVSSDARAQQGCCEGGAATGANAWTAGNATAAQWPADPTPPPYAGPIIGKAEPLAAPYWWTHGEIEFGLRGFINDPSRDGALAGNTPGGGYAFLGQSSLAKYYEYSTIAPGPFGGGHIATGTSDGLYQADLWANNIGYADQAYLLQLSKAGEQYFTFGWDQTPHLYSTSAQTPYLGVGTTALTLPAGLPSKTATNAGIIVPFLHQTDVGIERDTASANYRWTPTEAWDIRADYSHMDRDGTIPAGVVGFAPAGSSVFASPTQVPAPVNDTTQNFGANGEYAGLSPWGQRYTFKVAYNGSVYTDNISSYTVQNPYCTGATAATCSSATLSPFARESTPPSNEANGISGTLAADLPHASRYVGTLSFTRMSQNATFQPMTANPSAAASPTLAFGGLPWNQVNFGFINGNFAMPTSSLDGQIDTLLSNNTLTTKITPDLTSKLSYRYYDFDNETPRIIFPAWVSYDQVGNNSTTAPSEKTISSLVIGYIKQDAAANLNWRPSREWNFNAESGYERYNYTQTDVNVTNEYSAKVSADWKPTIWLTARASGYYADRRYDIYDYQAFVQSLQFPTIPGFAPQTSSSWFYAPAYQQFMFDNRQRTKAQFMLDVVAFRGVTITPNFKYQDDYYGLNPSNQEGVSDSRSTSWGVDVGWVARPDLSFTFTYYWEQYKQTLYNYSNTYTGNGSTNYLTGDYEAAPGTCTPPFTATNPNANCLITTADRTDVNTLTAAMSYAAIPGKLNFDLRYAISYGVDHQLLLLNPNMPASACTNCVGAFPDDTTMFQRLDFTTTYNFDPPWVRQWGFAGDLKAKLRYTWERNAVSNWQNDLLAPFNPASSPVNLPSAIFLAYDNPNYSAHMVAASLIASW